MDVCKGTMPSFPVLGEALVTHAVVDVGVAVTRLQARLHWDLEFDNFQRAVWEPFVHVARHKDESDQHISLPEWEGPFESNREPVKGHT